MTEVQVNGRIDEMQWDYIRIKVHPNDIQKLRLGDIEIKQVKI